MFIKTSFKNFDSLYKNILIFKFNYFVLFIFVYKNYYLCFFFNEVFKKLNYFSEYFLDFGKLVYRNLDLYKAFNSLFFCELYVDGLYYRIKYYTKYNILGFILGYNHYILYKLPIVIRACVHMKKRRFFLFGFDLVLLGNLANEIVNLKYPNLFKGKGLKIISTTYRKKILVKKAK